MDEQRNADHDQDERDDPPGDECDLEVRRRSVLPTRGDLFQSCRLLARMPNETLDFGLDDLAERGLVRRPVGLLPELAHATAPSAART